MITAMPNKPKDTGKKTSHSEPEGAPENKYRYIYFPRALVEELDKIAEDEDRSTAYMAKKAIMAFIAEYRKAHPKDSP